MYLPITIVPRLAPDIWKEIRVSMLSLIFTMIIELWLLSTLQAITSYEKSHSISKAGVVTD